MRLKFPESEISKWANSYDCSQEEKALLELKPKILKLGYVDKIQLKQVAHWKSPRSASHIDKNSDEFVKDITTWSLSAKDERSKIEVLTLLDGVSWPSASVILHFFHYAPYPILDIRALWSVGMEINNQYSFSFWWPYVEFCRQVVERNSLDMRTLDRALWQYSKENQKV